MSAPESDSNQPAKTEAPLSIVDLIIQEQMEKNALVLAPRPPKPEPEPEPEAEAQPEVVAEEPAVEEAPAEPEPELLGGIPLEDTATITLAAPALTEADTMFLGPSAPLDDEDIFAVLIQAQEDEEEDEEEPAETAPTQPLSEVPAAETPPAATSAPAAEDPQPTALPGPPPADLQLPPQVQRVSKPEPTAPVPAPIPETSSTINLVLPKIPDKAGRTVGGKLRDLEESFAKSEKETLPAGLKERALAAITLLSKLPGVQRALVLVEESPGEFRCVAKAGVSGNDYLIETPLHLMRSVLRTKEPLLMLDTTRDPRLMNDRQLQEMKVMSGLCAPFSDCVSGCRGVLYADNQERPNAFTHTELSTVKDFCKRLAQDRDLGQYRVAAAEQSKPKTEYAAAPQIESAGFDPRWIAAAVCVAVIGIWPSLSNPPKKEVRPKSVPVKVTREVGDPKVVALSFLRAVETSNFPCAYNYIDGDKRKTLTIEQFSRLCTQFTKDAKNKWLLAGLSVVDGPIRGGGLRTLRTVGTDGEDMDWEITLKRSGDEWCIRDLKGMKGMEI